MRLFLKIIIATDTSHDKSRQLREDEKRRFVTNFYISAANSLLNDITVIRFFLSSFDTAIALAPNKSLVSFISPCQCTVINLRDPFQRIGSLYNCTYNPLRSIHNVFRDSRERDVSFKL